MQPIEIVLMLAVPGIMLLFVTYLQVRDIERKVDQQLKYMWQIRTDIRELRNELGLSDEWGTSRDPEDEADTWWRGDGQQSGDGQQNDPEHESESEI